MGKIKQNETFLFDTKGRFINLKSNEENMSYLILARKYRPQTFEEVYSQGHITRILKNSILQDRIAQAYLFTGTRGVGKTSLARIFAKSLNCLKDNKPTPEPCNKCANCIDITNGTSPDVVEIDGASNTGVDDIRELQKELMYAPTNSRYKIFIIDEVHMLSKSAFNALLKTLEEPPEKVIFIFATTEPQKILPTIISRCQRFDFKRIPIPDIKKRLKEIADLENISVDDDALFVIARKADGSMRDALSLMDQVLAFKANDIKLDDVLQIFSIVHFEIYNTILKNILEKNPLEIVTRIQNLIYSGTDINEFLNGFLSFLRDLLLIKIGVVPQEVMAANIETMQALAKHLTEDKILYLMNMVIKTKTDVKSSDNPVLLLEMNFIKFTKLTELRALDKIIESFDKVLSKKQHVSDITHYEKKDTHFQKEKTPAAINNEIKRDAQPSKIQNQNTIPKIELTKENYEKYKDDILKKLTSSLVVALSDATLEDIRGNTIHLISHSTYRFQTLEKNKKHLEKTFSAFFGIQVKLNIELQEKSIDDISDFRATPTIESIRKENPALAEFIEIVGGEIED